MKDLGDVFGVRLRQAEVDFVLPRFDRDLPLCIDPFLLYNSRQPELQEAHRSLIGLFDEVFLAFQRGDRARAAAIVDFPEAGEIRFGYAKAGHRGRGIGKSLGALVLDTLEASPALARRRLRHVEELQLFSVGIGQDRISDLAANVLRRFLIKYTQEQATQWGIPIHDAVPIPHIWDEATADWVDEYVSIPVVPETWEPILLVPRWIVRTLPWINYQDYAGSTLRAYMAARHGKRSVGTLAKMEGVEISRREVALVDSYIDRKERDSRTARPSLGSKTQSGPETGGQKLLDELAALKPGIADAYEYQHLVLRILNALFEPDLVDGREQVRTESGVEIRDVVFSNNSETPFLRYVMTNHGNHVVVFECKNKNRLDPADVSQLAGYLGDTMGYVGVIVTRKPASETDIRRCIATFAKSNPRRVILILSDEDIAQMLSANAIDGIRRRYRAFMERVD